MGIAGRVAATLPPDGAAALTRAANEAYIDAITHGFAISAAVMLAALVVAVTMIPRRMRTAQAEASDGTAGVPAGNGNDDGDVRQQDLVDLT